LPNGILVASGILIAAVGCGPAGDRLGVSGAITLDGAPLDSGSIRFTSVGAEKLLTSGALIKDGAYHVPQENGLRAGTYQVEINSPDDKGPQVLDKPSGMMMAAERIPAAYNVESEQTIEVTAEGDNAFYFNIVSQGKK
jgi:hypothetical protein